MHGTEDRLTLSERAAAFAQLASRQKEERAAARSIVRAIVRTIQEEPSGDMRPEWVTCGVAERLIRLSHRLTHKSPAMAWTLARTALTITDRLDATYPPSWLALTAARAWTQIATLHCGPAPLAALDALQHADDSLGPSGILEHERSIVRVVRAQVLQTLGRTTEALQLLRASRAAFETFGDRRRAAGCMRMVRSIRTLPAAGW